MKTLNRKCVKTHTITDQSGNSCTIERGKKYITSEEKDGAVVVFTNYWVTVPIDIFDKQYRIFTKK